MKTAQITITMPAAKLGNFNYMDVIIPVENFETVTDMIAKAETYRDLNNLVEADHFRYV